MTHEFEVVLMIYRSGRVLGSFLNELGRDVPVLLIDNSFGDEDLTELLNDYPNVRHIDAGGNIGFSSAANLGSRLSNAPNLVFMNPDTRPTADKLEALVTFLQDHPDVAACGAAGFGTAGGGAQPTLGRVFAHTVGLHRHRPFSGVFYQQLDGSRVEAEWIAGSCMAIRSDIFREIGGYDPYYFIYMSDFDLGLRLRQAGHRQMILGDIVIPHDDGGSSDLPSVWTWERRGRAWIRFLRRTQRFPTAVGMSLILIAGNGIRSLVYSLGRRSRKAAETRTYASAMLREFISAKSSVSTAHRSAAR